MTTRPFVVGVPHCNEPADIFARTIMAITGNPCRPARTLVLDNGDTPLVLDAPGVEIVRPGHNTGCAGAWNRLLHLAFARVETAILVNADCEIAPDTLERLLAHASPAIVCALGFSCFRIDADIYAQLGSFDEGYFPVYWEDTDYRYRAKLAGIPIIEWPVAEVERPSFGRARYGTGLAHGWRASDAGYQGWTGARLAWFYDRYEANRQRYVTKWGGMPGFETRHLPDEGRDPIMGGLLDAMKAQDPRLAAELETHFTAPNHYQNHLREILLGERRDGGSPRIVVETGVSYGISSDRILATLDEIGIPGHGLLYSIDPAPPDGVFEVSHPRWSKIRKISSEALGYVYEHTGPWDVFLHDSDHGVWCQTFEYEVAWHFVRPGGLILSDDVTWGTPPHRAWENFCARHDLAYDKAGHCAVARKPAATPGAPTARVDADFIAGVITGARALADAALQAYAPAPEVTATSLEVISTPSPTRQPVRAICICLPEYPEKIEKAEVHFTEHGLADVEFFWGINAPVAGLATWHPYEIDHPGSGFRMGAKPTGCWLSHYMLWNAMTRMTDDAYLVLEDDAQLHEGFIEAFAQAMRDVPSDWQILHLGHCCMLGRPARHVAGAVYEAKDQMCTHAYVLRRTAVPFLLKTLRKCWAPIDIQLAREVFPYLRTYAVIPRIVSQFNTIIPE